MKDKESLQWINVVLSEIALLDEKKGKSAIERCGRECAISHGLPGEAKKIRSKISKKEDIDLLFNTYKKRAYNTPRLYKEGNTIYLEYHECGCPIVNSGAIKNPFFCNCTRGYTKERFENLFGKPVKVDLLMSILNGDKICKQAITILD